MIKFVVSILAHNHLPYTKRCVESVLASKRLEEVYLVLTDNASSDGTEGYFRSVAQRAAARVIVNPRNEGFIGPNQLAFKTTDSEFFVALNNDAVVPPDWLDLMEKEFLADPLLAICGPKNTASTLTSNGNGTVGQTLDYIEGSCMMVRRDILLKHGEPLFGPEFLFAYSEDADLSLRMKSRGYKIGKAEFILQHTGSVTTQSVTDVDIEGYKIRNQHILMRKWSRLLAEKDVKKNILVVRKIGIGDVILTTPVIRAIKNRWPMANVTVSTAFPAVFDGNPDVLLATHNAVMGTFDATHLLDLVYETQPDKHIVEAYADKCGVMVDDWRPRLYASDKWREVVGTEVLPPGDTKVCVVNSGSITEWAGRQWSPDQMSVVTEALARDGYYVVLVGNQHTPTVACQADTRGKPYQLLIALMERASLFVGLDSSPFHVAQAFNTPSVAIFGCVEPKYRVIPHSRVIGLQAKGVGCLGCHHYLSAPRTITQTCLRGQFQRGQEPCMAKITPADVLEAVKAVEPW